MLFVREMSKRKLEDSDDDSEETKEKKQKHEEHSVIHVLHDNVIRPVPISNLTTRSQLEMAIRAAFFFTKQIDSYDIFKLFDVYGAELAIDGTVPFNSLVRLQILTKNGLSKREFWKISKIKDEVADSVLSFNLSLCNMIAEYAQGGFGYVGAKCDLWCPSTSRYWVGTVVKREGIKILVHFDGWRSSYDQFHDLDRPDHLIPNPDHPLLEVGTATGEQGKRAATFNTIPWDCFNPLCGSRDLPSHLYTCPDCKAVRKFQFNEHTWVCTTPTCQFINQEHHAHCEICYNSKPGIYLAVEILTNMLTM